MSITWHSEGADITDAEGKTHQLSHGIIARMSAHEAHAYGLPARMEASLLVRFAGRIDMPHFTASYEFEPFHHMHSWVRYQRTGALMVVGERQMRLHPQQLSVCDAIDALTAAGEDIALRLRAWPRVIEALHMQGNGHVVMASDIPQVRIQPVGAWPTHAMTREGRHMVPIAHAPHASWAMASGHRYFTLQSL